MKKFICFIFAVMVAVVPSFAWTSESFLDVDYDNHENYDFEPVYDSPMMYAARPRSVASDNLLTSLDNWSISFSAQPGFVRYYSYDFYNSALGGTMTVGPLPAYSFYEPYLNSDPLIGFSSSNKVFPSIDSLDQSDYTSNYVVDYNYLLDFVVDYTYTLPFSVSDFSSIELVFDLKPYYNTYIGSSYYGNINHSDFNIDILVDDTVVYGGPCPLSSGSFIYNSYSSFSTITIRVYCPKIDVYPTYDNSVGSAIWGGFLDSFFSLSVIDRDTALDGFNNQAQSEINQHNQIESQWTGSMTDNFDALNIDSFTFPVGLVSAFGLISGIFNDLWQGMGEYKIVYVFPLTLGVVLVIIGKMSRTERKSSSGSGGGESSVSLVVRDR